MPDKYSTEEKHDHNIDRAFLLEHLSKTNIVLLETARQDSINNRNFLFTNPEQILTAYSAREIPAIFDRIETALAANKYVAGYMTYEAGFHFEQISSQHSLSSPLLWFGIYQKPMEIEATLLRSLEDEKLFTITQPQFNLHRNDYIKKIHTIKQFITHGETYQVNFTDKFIFDFSGDSISFYLFLREKQRVPYSALIRTEFGEILSFSPELFFRRDGNTITTKPMKGTCKRGRTVQEDADLSLWLHNDKKNQSENLMIVDLLRNDLGRICEPGSITVSEMFSVEKLETILQMTSTISGRLPEKILYYDIFKALFPCGSVTGAPKIRTMQIIDKLEQQPRGIYCGAIGYFSPGAISVFNVGIRTIHLEPCKKKNSRLLRNAVQAGTMGAGSGIVFDSEPENEFDECLVKANFLRHEHPQFELLETIKWDAAHWIFIDEHIARMQSSAEYFGFPFNEKLIQEECKTKEHLLDPVKQYRVRILLSQTGNVSSEVSILKPIPGDSKIKIASEKTDSTNPMYFHKTTYRPLYNKYRQLAESENILDYIFLNENNEITEGTNFNIIIRKGNFFYTPPLSCGAIGIYRSYFLRTNSNTVEKTLIYADVLHADEIYLCNSVRGLMRAELLLE